MRERGERERGEREREQDTPLHFVSNLLDGASAHFNYTQHEHFPIKERVV